MSAPEWELGYHKLFHPLVKRMPTNRVIRAILERTARVRTVAIRRQMRGQPISWEARAYRLIRPVIFITGWLIRKGIIKRAEI